MSAERAEEFVDADFTVPAKVFADERARALAAEYALAAAQAEVARLTANVEKWKRLRDEWAQRAKVELDDRIKAEQRAAALSAELEAMRARLGE